MFSARTQRLVAATYSRVPLAGKLFLLLLGLMLLSSTVMAAQIGPNDFRISTQTAAAGITVSSVAYNTSTNDYLVVWQGVDETGKPGIFGQLINANTGAEVGPDDFFIVTVGTAGDPDSGAANPVVVYNDTRNEFLVVFVGDTNDSGNNVDEIYAQRVSAAGSPVGSFLRVSDMGDDSSNFNAANPDAVYNSTDDAYLVVWEGDDNTNELINNEIEIFGQLVGYSSGDLTELGNNDFQISDTGGANGATASIDGTEPAVAWNSTNNTYLVVWRADDLTDNDFDIFGQQLDSSGAEIGTNDFQISTTTANSTAIDTVRPDVAYNVSDNEYLVVWSGDGANGSGSGANDYEIWGQLLNANTAAAVGSKVQISVMGSLDNSTFVADHPAVAYNSTDDEYLVVWHGDTDTGGLVDNEFEIFGTLLSPTLTTIEATQPLSDMGTNGEANPALQPPAVAFSEASLNNFLVTWAGENPGVTDPGEVEVWGQLVGDAPVVAPSVTIDQAAGQADPTSDSPINFTVVFSESVTGFADEDVDLSGTAGATTAVVSEIAPNDGTTYNVAVSGMTSSGTVIADIPADVANGNSASTSSDNTVTFIADTTNPEVTINQAAGQTDPTGSSPINFTVIFSEAVTGFANGDVDLSGTAGATTAVVTQIAPNDGTTYNVAVSGMTGSGTVIASIPVGAAEDGDSNPSNASTSTDNQVTFIADTVNPEVTINQASGQADPTGSSPINFTVVFNEPVTGFTGVDVDLSGTAGATTADVTQIAPNNGTTYNVAVSGMTGSGTVIASIPAGVAQDGDSNPNNASTSSDNNVTFNADTVNPEVTINQASGQADPTGSSPINFTVIFNEPVTGFAANDVVLSGTAGATTADVTQIAPNNGTTYNVAVSGMANSGTVIASVPAGAAQDGEGNPNNASTSTDNQVTFSADTVNPEVTINQASGQADPTNSSPINFTVVFNEAVTGFTGNDVNLSGSAGATTAVVTQIAPNNGTTYRVAVSGMTGSGTVIASVPAGAAQDGEGNPNNASTSSDNQVTFNTGGGGDESIYVSAATPGSVGGVNFRPEDILHFNGNNWSLAFDGSAVGLGSPHNINASHVNGANDLYVSFLKNKATVTGVGAVFGQDILHWNGSSFSLFFDGSDVGLSTKAERIDALHILDGNLSPIGTNCDAYILISTIGAGRVKGINGKALKFGGEDIVGFCMTSSGTTTSGSWHLVVDGSAEKMPRNSTFNLSASDDGQTLYVTTKGKFKVDGANGGHSMVYKFDRPTGLFSGPFFSAPGNGLTVKMDGLHVEGDLP